MAHFQQLDEESKNNGKILTMDSSLSNEGIELDEDEACDLRPNKKSDWNIKEVIKNVIIYRQLSVR